MKRRLPNIKHRLTMQDDGDELEIFIFDEIHSFFGVSAAKISELLADHPDVSTIIVHINSPGGNALDGVAIYNALQTHSATVDVIVEGMALSAASLIAMAGDTIKMAAGSQMMVHEARGMTHGTADAIRKFAEVVESTTGQMAQIYAARSGRELKLVAKDLKDETFMTADQAVELGYATEVLQAKALAAHFDMSEFGFRRLPDAVANLACGRGEELDLERTAEIAAWGPIFGDDAPSGIEAASAAINKLPDAAFAVIEPGGTKDDDGKTIPRTLRHLPHHVMSVKNASDNDSIDKPRLRNALARIGQTDITEAQRKKAQVHLDTHADAVLPSRQNKKALDSPSDDGLGDDMSPSPIAVMSGLSAGSPITNMTRKNP